MKKSFFITFLFITLLFATSGFAIAQTIREGYVKYQVSNVTGDGMAAFGLKGAKQIMYFSKKFTKIVNDMQNGMAKTDVVIENKTQKSTLITSGVALGKNVVSYGTEDPKGSKKAKFTITYDIKSKKTIIGYECTKAVLKNDDGEIILWITDKIAPANSPFFRQFPDLKGFPLEFQVVQTSVRATFTATEVGSKVDKNTFAIPTKKEGYEQLTLEEFNAMLTKKSQ
ncbi:MAG: hypothetical protein RI894_1498 [Bacteroidota bacterium]|jgi:hypothetical protein